MHDVNDYENRRILIVDDNPSIHTDLRKILIPDEESAQLADAKAALFGEATDARIRMAYEVHSAFQGQEALKKVRRGVESDERYALAIVDMRMPPGWDGLETIERVWQEDPDIQIVICTAYSDQSWSEIVKRLGERDNLLILKKPFDITEVSQLAVALTAKWELLQQARLKLFDLESIVAKRTNELREKDSQLHHKHKLEAVGSLASGIAHEFNNLLQVIRGYTRFAMNELPEDEQPHCDLQHVVEAVDQAAEITRQLLEFSRQTPAIKSDQEANQILTTTMQMVRPILGEQIDLEVVLGDDTGVVRIDPSVLSQAIVNLCINARDAMPAGGKLVVKSEQTRLEERYSSETPNRPDLAPGFYAMISVADTGCGMPRDVQEKIFTPFFTTKTPGKGTGMGLASVYGAVQQHDGAVTVESVEGQGATFRVFLPLVSQATKVTRQPVRNNGEKAWIGNETILVAEDEPLVRNVAVRVLQEAGYQVVIAVDGEDAMDKFEQHADAIRLALVDVVMPKLSGRQVCERIKQADEHMKVVLCTGYDPETAHGDSVENKQLPVVYKPFVPELLLSTIRETLDKETPCQAV